jgi:hypothetical protein
MDVLLVYSTGAAVLFIAVYLTKRRFGLLGLALASGSILSDIWGRDALYAFTYSGAPTGPLAAAVILSGLILLPAGILLFHGYAYKSKLGRTGGALLFTVLALAFLVEPLGHVLMLQGFGSEVYDWLVNNREIIIGIGLALAVLDMFFTKPAHLANRRRSH